MQSATTQLFAVHNARADLTVSHPEPWRYAHQQQRSAGSDIGRRAWQIAYAQAPLVQVAQKALLRLHFRRVGGI